MKPYDLEAFYGIGYCNRLAAAALLDMRDGGNITKHLKRAGCRHICIPRGDNGRATWLFCRADVEEIAARKKAVAEKKAAAQVLKPTKYPIIDVMPKPDTGDLFSTESRLSAIEANNKKVIDAVNGLNVAVARMLNVIEEKI